MDNDAPPKSTDQAKRRGDAITGRYQHYKGGVYDVIGVAHHSETLEKLVVYRALYDHRTFGAGSLWVRPMDAFFEDVEIDGKHLPRFKKLSESPEESAEKKAD